ncbi:hypothetical protein GCM10022221_63790 [Actinocorallia aurea]
MGVDLAEDSPASTDYALEAALSRGARLRAIYAWDFPGSPNELHGFDGLVDPAEELARRIRDAAARHPGVETETAVLEGHPVEVLAEAAKDAALLVVGSHGRGPVKGLMFGSVGHGVLHHAHCPVAVVPEPEAP